MTKRQDTILLTIMGSAIGLFLLVSYLNGALPDLVATIERLTGI